MKLFDKRKKYRKTSIGDKSELQRRLLFTVLMLCVFKLLSFIPTPFVKREVISSVFKGGVLDTVTLFSGGAVSSFTIMATGISSYITASIVLQLLTYSFKRLHDLSRSSGGEKLMKRITMALGIVMSVATSLAMTTAFNRLYGFLTNNSWYVYLIIAIIHALGTYIAISIGESITKKGYGNGVSLLITMNIVGSFPLIGKQLSLLARAKTIDFISIVILTLVMVIAIIVVDSSEKRIPVRYTRAVARGYGRVQNKIERMPIKLNMSGVMPIILAATILQFFTFIFKLTKLQTLHEIADNLSRTSPWYALVMALLIFSFTLFYSSISFNATETAEALQKNGGVLLGVKPGKDTVNYLRKINKSLTRFSALYLALISLIPFAMTYFFNFSGIQATSIMIVVGVSLESMTKLNNEYKLGKMRL